MDMWMREHWVVAALVGAIAIAVGFAVGTALFGGSQPFVAMLVVFIAALAVGLPLRRGQARRLR